MRRTSRKFNPYRQAYYPSAWPVCVATGALSGVLSIVLSSVAVAISVGTLVGVIAAEARLAHWKRQHPVLPPQQLVEMRRRVAHWN